LAREVAAALVGEVGVIEFEFEFAITR